MGKKAWEDFLVNWALEINKLLIEKGIDEPRDTIRKKADPKERKTRKYGAKRVFIKSSSWLVNRVKEKNN